MNITFNIYYKSNDGKARKFVEEMISSGIVKKHLMSITNH